MNASDRGDTRAGFGRHQRDGREDGHGEPHAVQDVHLQQALPRQVRQRHQRVVEAEQEGQQEKVARAPPEFEQPFAARPGVPVERIHLEGEGHAGHEEEERRRHAAHELREHVRAAGARIRVRQRVEGVALDHEDHRQAAGPVQVSKAVQDRLLTRRSGPGGSVCRSASCRP